MADRIWGKHAIGDCLPTDCSVEIGMTWADTCGGACPVFKMAVSLGPTVFCQVGGGGTFLALSDTPSSFATHGGKQVRVNGGATALEFVAPGTGCGDVSGPATSTDNALTRFCGAAGKTIQNSGMILDDCDVFSSTVAVTRGGLALDLQNTTDGASNQVARFCL